MTREQLVEAIARDAQERASRASGTDVRLAYRREAEAVLESIEAAGWTVVPHETAQALDDSAVLASLARSNGGT